MVDLTEIDLLYDDFDFPWSQITLDSSFLPNFKRCCPLGRSYTAWRMTSPRLMTRGRPNVSRISVWGS
jgi:hypothetical protein